MRHRPVERPRRVGVRRQIAQGVGRVDQRVPPDIAWAHVRSAAPAFSRTARLIALDAARGAGLVRRRPAERQRRVRVVRPHAQCVGRVERAVPPDADRAHTRSAAPASSRTACRSLVDFATGAGPVCRRAVEGPRRVRIVGRNAQGVGRVERSVPLHAARAHGLGAAPASCQTKRPSNQGRRSSVSSRCRTAASCPGRSTARSRCGTSRPVSASGR